ncbi:MAG: hypothetical protein KA248_09295 [Kiritimatiellae bacterium]|nr:hypothetical protein [Kiritimatiellia bacterium]
MRLPSLSTLLVCVAVLSGCRTDRVISEFRHVPKNPRFSIQPADYTRTDMLDFQAVYYTVDEAETKYGTRKAYNYLRFWPTGHVLIDFADHLPDAKEAEDFSHAYLGYYRLHERKIVLEFFSPDTGRWRWDYGRDSGYVDGDSIVITSSTLGARSWENRIAFTRHPVEGLKRRPDW